MNIEGKFSSAKIYAVTVDDGTIEQTKNICDHPIFAGCKIRIMPDCHKGKGCTIGFTSEMPKGGEIIPNIIGVDQSCGMYVIKLIYSDNLNEYEKLDKVIRKNIPTGTGARKELSELLPEELKEKIYQISKDTLKDESSEEDLLKIGTLGSGNHFISIEKGTTGIYLIIHSGSRNFGNKLAVHFQNLAIEKNCYGDNYLKQLSYLTGKDAENYLYCADVCRDYAHWSRKIMAEVILKNMNWQAEETFETLHNYIGKDNIIRKGAISAHKDEKVLIPLNMADGSLICIGKGNKDWNDSAPHGAGRISTRTQAKANLSMDEYKSRMQGIFTTCISTGTLDESPMAYKNADEIIKSVEPAVEIIDHIKPLYNFKAG